MISPVMSSNFPWISMFQLIFGAWFGEKRLDLLTDLVGLFACKQILQNDLTHERTKKNGQKKL